MKFKQGVRDKFLKKEGRGDTIGRVDTLIIRRERLYVLGKG